MGVQQAAPQLDRLGNMAVLHIVAVGQIGHRARHAQGPVHAARTPAEARSGLLQKVPRLFRQLDGLFQGLTLQGGIGLMLALQRPLAGGADALASHPPHDEEKRDARLSGPGADGGQPGVQRG